MCISFTYKKYFLIAFICGSQELLFPEIGSDLEVSENKILLLSTKLEHNAVLEEEIIPGQ